MNKIVAHRGFSSKKLENTLPSFEMAFKEKYVDIVELDIRMTKDRKIVCIHDSFIKNKANGKEYIKDNDYAELKKPILRNKDFFLQFFRYASNVNSFVNLFRLLRYKRKKGTIPLLTEVLEMLPDNKEVLIEIKGGNEDYEGIVYEEKILKIIDKYQHKKLAIMGDNKEIIMSIKNKRPKLKTGILIRKNKNVEDAQLPIDFVSLSKKVITYELVEMMLKNKKEVIVWTIDTYSDFLYVKKTSKELFDRLAITTNFPDLIYHLVKKNKKKKEISS